MVKYSVLMHEEKIGTKKIISKLKLKECCRELEKTASLSSEHTCSCGNQCFIVSDEDTVTD